MKKISTILLTLVLSIFPLLAFAASPARTGTDISAELANGASNTVAMTVPSATNSALICLVGRNGQNGAPDAVKWQGSGGTSLTQIYNVSGAQQTTGLMYYLANPTAATDNIYVDWATTNLDNGGFLFCATYQDMHQDSGTVLDTSGHQNSGSSNHPTQSVTTSVDSDIVISWVGSNVAAGTMSPDSPQSQIASQVTDLRMSANASDQPQDTAGAITSGFTFSGLATSEDLYVVALKYAAAVVTVQPTYQEIVFW